MSDENLIKKTCKELGLTYRELGEAIGYSEAAVKAAIAKNELSEPMRHALELYQENISLRAKNREFEAFKEMLKGMLKG
ncbi:MAG: transcriptional regulator [Wolinella sp.]